MEAATINCGLGSNADAVPVLQHAVPFLSPPLQSRERRGAEP